MQTTSSILIQKALDMLLIGYNQEFIKSRLQSLFPDATDGSISLAIDEASYIKNVGRKRKFIRVNKLKKQDNI